MIIKHVKTLTETGAKLPNVRVKLYDQAQPAAKDVDMRVSDGEGNIPNWNRTVVQGAWEADCKGYQGDGGWITRDYDTLEIRLVPFA